MTTRRQFIRVSIRDWCDLCGDGPTMASRRFNFDTPYRRGAREADGLRYTRARRLACLLCREWPDLHPDAIRRCLWNRTAR